MKLIITALQEVYGLFVEDGSYALGILVWVIAAVLLLPKTPAGAAVWSGPLLFLGFALLLVENVLRTARKRSR